MRVNKSPVGRNPLSGSAIGNRQNQKQLLPTIPHSKLTGTLPPEEDRLRRCQDRQGVLTYEDYESADNGGSEDGPAHKFTDTAAGPVRR